MKKKNIEWHSAPTRGLSKRQAAWDALGAVAARMRAFIPRWLISESQHRVRDLRLLVDGLRILMGSRFHLARKRRAARNKIPGMLSRGATSNALLHASCRAGYRRLALHAIKQGADIESIRRDASPLGIACFHGDIQLVRVLLKAGANPNGVMPGGALPLYFAVCAGRFNIVKILIAAGAKPQFAERSIGHSAAKICLFTHQLRILRFLIQSGLKANQRYGPHDQTLLHLAAALGDRKGCGILLEAGADVNALDSDKGSPLFGALACANGAMWRFLADRGAELSRTEHDQVQQLLLVDPAIMEALRKKSPSAAAILEAIRDN